VKNLGKKIMIVTMIGVMQAGFSAAVLEASPFHNNHAVVQYDDNQDTQGPPPRDPQVDHDERFRKENERHEREMRRHDHESEREWQERQERERQQHEDNLREIEALVIGIIIGSSN